MQFGAMVNTKIDEWQTLKLAEELGYDSGWAPDSQMIWSDCYAVLALAAANTSRIRLGTGVAIPGTRLAPVTAHSIASIARLAPGRAFLGIGTGHTAMRIMGLPPMKPRAFRDYLRVVRGLLHGEEVEFTHDGVTRPIRFQNRDMGFIGFEPPVPIHVAANGPMALEIAGELGDGRICAGAEPLGVMARNLDRARAGAEKAGRRLPDDFHASTLTFFCAMKPGDKVSDPHIVEEIGAQVGATLHYWWEHARIVGHDNFIPDYARDDWDLYNRFLADLGIPDDRMHLRVHLGHCSFLPEAEHRFVTPAMVQATGGLVGEPDLVVERIRAMESAGCREIVLLPPKAVDRRNFRQFAEEIMPKFR